MLELLTSTETWISLATLSVMEIVLGIDNIVFISILTSRLPEADRDRGRKVGLSLALLMRLGLIFAISWIVGLTQPLFAIASVTITGKALVLLAGGIFLIYKATHEIHNKLEGSESDEGAGGKKATMRDVLIQIALLDLVFSLDSVITAVGMAPHVSIMVAANVLAIIVMLFASVPISRFVEAHPTVKMLALSFLLLIGFTLTIEAVGVHIPKGYIYFAMGFSIFVEALNLRTTARQRAVKLRNVPVEPEPAPGK